jgi:hypothetical protein
VVQDLIVYAAFGMTGVVSREPIAAPAARQRPEKGFALFQFIEVQIEEARAVTIYQRHPQARLRAQNHCQCFQVKAAIDEKPSVWEQWREIELAPDVPAATGEDGLGASLISVQSRG